MSAGSGFDPGHARLRLLEVRTRKGAVEVRRFHALDLEPGEDPQEATGGAFGAMRRKPAPVRVGLTGADLMLRYLPVPEVEDWRLERLMEFEVRELEGRSGAPLASSYNLLPVPKELDEEDTVLLGLVREDLLDGWLEALGGLPVQGFTPNAVALYNAYLALGDHEPSVTLLANLGHGTLDLALVRGTDLYFARSVTTGLERRDRTLAGRLGVDETRARRLVHRHLDLELALGKRLDSDADRVTRPLLALYEPLPTLLGSMVTLCKAQARLRDLSLDRVLLTGGGAAARGLVPFLTERLKVPVSLWNPCEMVAADGLPPEQQELLEADGPGAAVALGLALSAADPDLYALEILPRAALRRREFRERGVWAVVAGVLAAAFLVVDFVVTSGRAADLESEARRLERQAQARERSEAEAQRLLEGLAAAEEIHGDLYARRALQRSVQEAHRLLAAWLPAGLWVEGIRAELQAGDDWGLPGQAVPVVQIRGKGESRERDASALFGEFSERVKGLLPGGEAALRPEVSRRRREVLDWSLTLHFLAPARVEEEEEE